ncbi:DUF2760 domain-containing protein [Aquincola sp. MAHUQ-54]|uniref:DUF2760 domain-containing protein n=1 Tax=Aquincola agrisoli TaxID=3119538 RepID=A0AAW9QPA4_9BURK
MNDTLTPPGFLRRIPLAVASFFRVLFDGEFAARVVALRSGPPASATPSPTPPVAPVAPLKAAPVPAPSALRDTSPDSALQLLALLQRDGRLIDFAHENLTGHADADIGAAARLVHEGVGKVLREHFLIEPVRSEPEGSRIVLEAGFDAAAHKLTGRVAGEPPFKGSLGHRGWRVAEVRLPQLAERHDARVIAPAEIEL